MVQQYDALIRNTLSDANQKGLSVLETRELLIRQNISDYTNAIYSEVQANDPDKYGFSSPGKAISDLTKETIDSGMPLPLTSEKEQARRLK